MLVFGVGLRAWHRAHPGRGVPADNFLTARDARWIPVGTALVASSSGSEHLVVLAGQRASSGVGSPSSRSSPPSFSFCSVGCSYPSTSGAGPTRRSAPGTDHRPWKGVRSGVLIPMVWYRCTDRCVVQGSRVRRRSPMLAGRQSLPDTRGCSLCSSSSRRASSPSVSARMGTLRSVYLATRFRCSLWLTSLAGSASSSLPSCWRPS